MVGQSGEDMVVVRYHKCSYFIAGEPVFIAGLDTMQGRCLSEYEANSSEMVRGEWYVIEVAVCVRCAWGMGKHLCREQPKIIQQESAASQARVGEGNVLEGGGLEKTDEDMGSLKV